MNPFLYFGLGMLLAALMIGLGIWSARSRIEEASEFLNRNGMEVHTYLPAFGQGDDGLRTALETMEGSGKVVIDKDGRMVGRLLPKIAPDQGVRLVVDNTKL